MAYHLNSRQL